MTFTLRDYQLELVEGVQRSMLKGNKKILVQSAAGSGKSVTMAEIARLATEKGNRILLAVHRRELVDQLKSTFYANGVDPKLSHIGMVQTITNRLDTLETPDIIFFDEAHHALAKTYKRIIEHFSQSYVYGFTATPVRTNGAGMGEVFDDLIIGKSVQWLIDNHRLAPYKYYSVDLTNHDKLKLSSTRDFTYDSISESLGKAIFGDVIETYEKLAKGEKTIVYTHNVQTSKDVAQAFNQAGYSAKQVDGKTSKTEREKAMEDFRSGKITLLTNADIYGEGVDVPDATTVILLRPTMSLSLHIQQSMRPMRYQPNKVAKIIDHVGNVYRHGLPDTEHQWTLESKEKRKKDVSSDDVPSLTTCPFCFGILKSGTNPCTLCGEEIETEAAELEQLDGEIEEIDQETFVADYEMIRFKKEWGGKQKDELETVEDYYLFAKARGYKDSWLKFQVPEFKRLNWPQFYIQIKPLKQKYKNLN